MIIVSTFFKGINIKEKENKYEKLLRIFYNSAKENMPDSVIHIVKTNTKQNDKRRDKFPDDRYAKHDLDAYYGFMTKISHVVKIMGKDNVLMSDCDVVFIQSVESIWKKDFDVAITVRDIQQRYNSGVVFIKPTQAAKKFMKSWKQYTEEIGKRFEISEYREWWGIDQTALHYALQNNADAKILELPCHLWNAEQKTWKNITAETKIIHLKDALREIVCGNRVLPRSHAFLQPIIERIQKYANNQGSIEFYRSPETGISEQS